MVLTYIYVMLNKRNGFVKIGRSDEPAFREKTLQSEEPEVGLLFAYLCEPSVERELHSAYAKKRLRGEWFELSIQDVLDVDTFLDRRAPLHRIKCDIRAWGDFIFNEVGCDPVAVLANGGKLVQ